MKVLQQKKDSLIGKYHTQIKSQTTTHETWLTTEEKEKLKVLQQRKDSLIGKYHTQIKSQTTTHETWLNTLDDLQAYAIYSTAINTFKETKDKTTKQYNKDLEAIELEIDGLAKEINKQILTREQKQKRQIEQKKYKNSRQRVKVYYKILEE